MSTGSGMQWRAEMYMRQSWMRFACVPAYDALRLIRELDAALP